MLLIVDFLVNIYCNHHHNLNLLRGLLLHTIQLYQGLHQLQGSGGVQTYLSL